MMNQKFMRIAAASSMVVLMGLGSSAIAASAKTATHKKTTLGRVIIAPKAVTGTQYIMTIKKGTKNYTTVTFDIANVKLVDHRGGSIAVDKITVGNKIKVKGLINDSSKKITDVSKVEDESIK